MNNWLNKLERKYGRFGIPNLTNILVAGQILVFAIELFIDRTITAWVGLNRFFLLQGQIWRAITFVFIPFSGGSILSVVLGIYFTWFVGTALGKGVGRFPLYPLFPAGHGGHGAGLPAYRRDGQHLLSVPFAAAGLCHAVPGGTAAAVLRDPHPGEVFRLLCGGPVGVQLLSAPLAGKLSYLLSMLNVWAFFGPMATAVCGPGSAASSGSARTGGKLLLSRTGGPGVSPRTVRWGGTCCPSGQ